MDTPSQPTFASWLDQFLKTEQLRAKDFAAKIGVTESMVSKLRAGAGVKPSETIIERIATRYGVPRKEIPLHNYVAREDSSPVEGAGTQSSSSGNFPYPQAVFDSIPDHILLNWGIQKGFFQELGLHPDNATNARFDYPKQVLNLVEEEEKVLFVVPVERGFVDKRQQAYYLSNWYNGHSLITRADAPLTEVRFGPDALARFRELLHTVVNADALWQVAVLNDSARDFYACVVEFFFHVQGLKKPEEFQQNLADLPTAEGEGLINRLRNLGSQRSDFIVGHALTSARARIADDPKGVLMKEVLNWNVMMAVIDALPNDAELRARIKVSVPNSKNAKAREEQVEDKIRALQSEWRKAFENLRTPVVWCITNTALAAILEHKKDRFANETDVLRALSRAADKTIRALKQDSQTAVDEISELLVTHQRGYNEQRVFWRSLKEQVQKIWDKSYEFLDHKEREDYLNELTKPESPYFGYADVFARIKELMPPKPTGE